MFKVLAEYQIILCIFYTNDQQIWYLKASRQCYKSFRLLGKTLKQGPWKLKISKKHILNLLNVFGTIVKQLRNEAAWKCSENRTVLSNIYDCLESESHNTRAKMASMSISRLHISWTSVSQPRLYPKCINPRPTKSNFPLLKGVSQVPDSGDGEIQPFVCRD